MIAAGRHDIALFHDRLGRCDGLKVMRELVAQGFRAPLILLAGQARHDADVAAMKGGSAEFLARGTPVASSGRFVVRKRDKGRRVGSDDVDEDGTVTTRD